MHENIEETLNWTSENNPVNNGINLEEEFQKSSEQEYTALQKKFLSACGDISEEFKPATFKECQFKIGTKNGTPYLTMVYQYKNVDKIIEDNFYLSNNSYQHNLERLDSVLHIMGGKLDLTNMVNENVLKDYINKFKGAEVLISQFRNKDGHKLCNVASLPKEVE